MAKCLILVSRSLFLAQPSEGLAAHTVILLVCNSMLLECINNVSIGGINYITLTGKLTQIVQMRQINPIPF